MKIQIHARHAELAEDFKEIAEEKLNSMERFGVVIDRVEVEILHETNPRLGKHSHRVIVTSHGSGPLLRAEASEFNDVAGKLIIVSGGTVDARDGKKVIPARSTAWFLT